MCKDTKKSDINKIFICKAILIIGGKTILFND